MPLVNPFCLTRTEDQAAYNWVVQEVIRQSGNGEAVYAYDQRNGTKIAAWHESGFGANLDPKLKVALQSGVPVVLHHNHPSGGSFIPLDLQSLVGKNPNYHDLNPLAEMWAHGNHGTRYRIKLICPGYAENVMKADIFMSNMKAQWLDCCFGHEIFNSGWRHLVCLCLEAKGYVIYEYDVTCLPDYSTRKYLFGWTLQQLTQEQAFPLACAHIVKGWGNQF